MSRLLTVLLACGPNSIVITAMVFESLEQSRNTLLEIGFVTDDFQPAYEGKISIDTYQGRDLSEELKTNKVLSKSLFTSYYGGCGECHELVVTRVEAGKPFVSWDLD